MELTPEQKAEIKGAIVLAATVVVWVLAFAAWFCPPAKADFIAALHWPKDQCFPCRQMLPIEDALRAEGCDIRTIDITKQPEWASAPGRGVPRYVYVQTTPRGNFYVGSPIVGMCTANQLRRFCVAPEVVAIGAATRSAIRGVICPLTPYPVFAW